MYFTTAKFNSRCTETGARITKGDNILYDRENKKVYSQSSNQYKTNDEAKSTSDMVQSNEDQYFDNWAQNNL